MSQVAHQAAADSNFSKYRVTSPEYSISTTPLQCSAGYLPVLHSPILT